MDRGPRSNTFPRELEDLGYSLRRHFVDEFHLRHAAQLPPDGVVLDLGGNRIGKRGRFDIERYGLSVIYANLSSAKRPHVQCEAAALPFRNGAFSAAILSELLEHVPDPKAVLSEVRRALRPGGILLACVPFMNKIHGDPYDFGRYTDYYWSETLRDLGFTEVRIEKQGLFWSVLTDMVRDLACARTNRGFMSKPTVIDTLARIMTVAKRKALRWDELAAMKKDGFATSFTTGFGITARKP